MKDLEAKLIETENYEITEEMLFQRILKYMDDVPSANLRDVRETFGVDSTAFAKLFRKYLNTSPTEYLRIKRIKLAKRLLSKTKKSVSEISEECGMDLSAMGSLFRTYVGCNPSDYRRQCLRKKFQREHKMK